MRRAQLVAYRGAPAGAILRGVKPNNRGLQLRLLEAQPRGRPGAIQGRFVLLDAGDNKHSHALLGLVGRETDAQEILRLIRVWSGACLNVVNANILTAEGSPSRGVEQGAAPDRPLLPSPT